MNRDEARWVNERVTNLAERLYYQNVLAGRALEYWAEDALRDACETYGITLEQYRKPPVCKRSAGPRA